MGETPAAAVARKARTRKRRKRQRRRQVWRHMLDWRGRQLTGFGWYFVVLATTLGVIYGTLADDRGTGHAGLPDALIGAAVGIAWGAVTFALLPPFPGALAAVVSLFAALLTLGPTWPGAISAGLASVVAGWLLGIHLRFLAVGRRCPPPAPRLVDRTRPRKPAPITKAERTQLLFSGIGGLALIAFLAAWFLIPHPETLGTWLLVMALTAAWGVPSGWWGAMTRSHYALGGAPAMAVHWGMFFHVWAASALRASGLVLLGTMATIAFGFILRRLWEARRGRHPRARAVAAHPEPERA